MGGGAKIKQSREALTTISHQHQYKGYSHFESMEAQEDSHQVQTEAMHTANQSKLFLHYRESDSNSNVIQDSRSEQEIYMQVGPRKESRLMEQVLSHHVQKVPHRKTAD